MLNLKFTLKLVLTILIVGRSFGQIATQSIDNQTFNIEFISSEISTLEQSIKEDDQNLSKLLTLAKLYRVSDQSEKAIGLYSALVNRETVDPEVYFEYGECLRSIHAYTDALILFKKYAEFHPDQAKYFVQLCELSIENDKINDQNGVETVSSEVPTTNPETNVNPAPVSLPVQSAQSTENTKSADLIKPQINSLESPINVESKEKLPPNTKVYFIQITALSKFNAQTPSRFKSFAKYGDVYRVIVGDINKIRVGYFLTMNEALSQLNIMKKAGIKDAFLVEDLWDEKKMEILIKSGTDISNIPDNADSESSKYKIRVAEFKAPDWFDSSKISDLGTIEHWSKNGWTIIILAGYNSLEAVNETISKLKSRGFKESYPVVEREGKLFRLQ